jgi:hypothetical protein
VLVRNLVFQIVRALSMLDYATAADLLHESDEPWTAESLEQAMAGFYAEHNYVRTDPKARVPANTIIEPTDDGGRWLVNQVLCDREDLNDWVLECEIDMARSRAAQRPVITLRRIGS